MIEQEAESLRQERRAKMQQIKDNMTSTDLWRDGVTSAPSIREVDEFQEDLTAAEKRKRLMMEKATNQNGGPKAKLKLTTRKSDPVSYYCAQWDQTSS